MSEQAQELAVVSRSKDLVESRLDRGQRHDKLGRMNTNKQKWVLCVIIILIIHVMTYNNT